MKETGLTGKRRSTIIAATPDDGKSQRKRRRRIGECVSVCLCVYPSGHIHVAACGPIGTKSGTRMEIHLEMVMGEIKITLCDHGGHLGGFRGQKITNLE